MINYLTSLTFLSNRLPSRCSSTSYDQKPLISQISPFCQTKALNTRNKLPKGSQNSVTFQLHPAILPLPFGVINNLICYHHPFPFKYLKITLHLYIFFFYELNMSSSFHIISHAMNCNFPTFLVSLLPINSFFKYDSPKEYNFIMSHLPAENTAGNSPSLFWMTYSMRM